MIHILKSRDAWLGAQKEIGKFDQLITADIVKTLFSHTEPVVRVAAAKEKGWITRTGTEDLLIGLFQDESQVVRRAAAGIGLV